MNDTFDDMMREHARKADSLVDYGALCESVKRKERQKRRSSRVLVTSLASAAACAVLLLAGIRMLKGSLPPQSLEKNNAPLENLSEPNAAPDHVVKGGSEDQYGCDANDTDSTGEPTKSFSGTAQGGCADMANELRPLSEYESDGCKVERFDAGVQSVADISAALSLNAFDGMTANASSRDYILAYSDDKEIEACIIHAAYEDLRAGEAAVYMNPDGTGGVIWRIGDDAVIYIRTRGLDADGVKALIDFQR